MVGVGVPQFYADKIERVVCLARASGHIAAFHELHGLHYPVIERDGFRIVAPDGIQGVYDDPVGAFELVGYVIEGGVGLYIKPGGAVEALVLNTLYYKEIPGVHSLCTAGCAEYCGQRESYDKIYPQISFPSGSVLGLILLCGGGCFSWVFLLSDFFFFLYSLMYSRM